MALKTETNNQKTDTEKRPQRKKTIYTGRFSSIPEFLSDEELENRNKRKFQYMQITASKAKPEEKVD
jgi:hypothetical protein